MALFSGIQTLSPMDDADGYGSASLRAEPVAERPGAASGAVPVGVNDLARWLPRLGPTLWLQRCDPRRDGARPAAARYGRHPVPEVDILRECASLSAHATVTSGRPREWLCLRGPRGAQLARIFLLPDTDYFAWDEMSRTLRLTYIQENRISLFLHQALVRAVLVRAGVSWRAVILSFEADPATAPHALTSCSPLRLSRVGMALAEQLAHDNGAEL